METTGIIGIRFRFHIRVMLGLFRDNGKRRWKLLFRVWGSGRISEDKS